MSSSIQTGQLATNEPLTETQNDSATQDQEGAHVNKYTWRVDLLKSEQYWAGWYENLSATFLDLRGLDRALTVGQRKFQLQVLTHNGHAVHEVKK